MKKMFVNSIIVLLFSLTIIHTFPCPPRCICKPSKTNDVDFTRMSYLIDCTNASLNDEKLIYEAEEWSINEDRAAAANDDDSVKDYVISIDLSKSLSLKKFTNDTIRLSNFSYAIKSLSLTNEADEFILDSNSFYSPLYNNLNTLNLSSCCKQIPKDCPQVLRPLQELQVLDLSGSNLYKTCLSTPDTLSTYLRHLLLRNNIYDKNIFSRSNHIFDGIRDISGAIDFRNSHFQLDEKVEETCLFDTFQHITSLDLSSIQFESTSKDIDINLGRLLNCTGKVEDMFHGSQLVNLYLRQLKLQILPTWFTAKHFPLLKRLDLSNNNIKKIALDAFSNLKHISLAYNPIELNNMVWRSNTIYESINLRSTIVNKTFDVSRRLKILFKLSKNIDYSENEGNTPMNVTNIRMNIDFETLEFSLNVSRTNLYTFQINFDDIRRLDVSSNSLTELYLDKQKKLNYLDCSNQYLNKLRLSTELSDLSILKCSNNSLTTIENFSALRNDQLELIDLSSNSIDKLENLFLNITSRFLHTINLKFNLIKIIPSSIFHRQLISLYEINLSWNKIYIIKKNAFQSPNLQILDLTGNPLKTIESRAIFTSSLRLFFIVNDTQQLIDRCKRSKSFDNTLIMYVNWYKQNGTLMKQNPIDFDKCLGRYINVTRTDILVQQTKHTLKFYSLYLVICIVSGGVLLSGVHYYRKHRPTLFKRFQRYKRLNKDQQDQNHLEDDDIMMSMQEPPFVKLAHESTSV